LASLDQAAAHCFISSVRFRELLARGVITQMPRGKYDLDQVRAQFIKHLSRMAAGRDDGGGRLVEERTLLTRIKRQREELQAAIEAAKYAQLSVVQRVLEEGLLAMRDRLLALPAEAARAVVGFPEAQCVSILEIMVRDKLEELADPAGYAARAAAAGVVNGNGRFCDEENEETDAA
jgi:hypothetical protein